MSTEIAVVTGAGTGIGQAVALSLAERGLKVIGVGRRKEPLDALKAKAPEQIDIVAADISNDSGRNAIVAAVPDGALRYLVHNAAIVEPLGHLLELELAEFRNMQIINTEAPIFLTQALLPKFSKTDPRILHVSTAAAHEVIHVLEAYCVSKAALFMAYRCLKPYLAERGIALGSMMPGVVDTPMYSKASNNNLDFERYPELKDFQRWSEDGTALSPTLVAKFIGWLLCETHAEAFSEQEWDVYDESHQAHWARAETLRVPA